jgi:hypothetical protein
MKYAFLVLLLQPSDERRIERIWSGQYFSSLLP